MLNAAAALGTPVVVTHAGSPVSHHFYGTYSYPPGNPTDRAAELVEQFKAMYGPVVDHAADKDVRIALDCAVRMGNIACNQEMWDRVLDAVPSDHLGLSCDPSHWVWMMLGEADEIVRSYAGKWFYADVKDCEVDREMLRRQGIIGNWWWHYRVPGRRELDWRKITVALRESG